MLEVQPVHNLFDPFVAASRLVLSRDPALIAIVSLSVKVNFMGRRGFNCRRKHGWFHSRNDHCDCPRDEPRRSAACTRTGNRSSRLDSVVNASAEFIWNLTNRTTAV